MKRHVDTLIVGVGVLALAVGSLAQCASQMAQHQEPGGDPTAQMTAQEAATHSAQADQQARNDKMASTSTPERKEIENRFKWDTTHLFKSDAAWEKERKALTDSFAEISACKGKLKRGKKVVLTCLQQLFNTRKRLHMLINYAHRKHDQDTRQAKYQGYKQVIDKLATEYAEVTSFVEPELLALPESKLRAMIKDKAFAQYDQYLKEMLRLKPHILSPAEEKLLAATSLMREAGYNAYSTFSGADLSFPSITDENGKTVQLSQALFTRLRTSPDRTVRKATFDAFFGTYKTYKNTLASLLSAQINANIVYSKARKYRSALEASLDANNIPTAVYHNMVKAINAHLPLLHRYLKLRQKLLGLKDLRYYDMYPSIVKKVELTYAYDEGRALVAEAVKPMGQEYTEAMIASLDPQNGWVDVYPNKGKRSGAYMDGSAYEVHPFVLCNYLDNYNSVSTLAHEMGHAMHSYFSNKHQPFPKADYSIFLAEVASTLNEALLMNHMLTKIEDPQKRLYLLGEKLENFRQTIFRQSMFAEFELALYQRAEKKEALTADQISKIYLEIVRRYYGHADKVVAVDDLYGMEWAYVPHFYYNYYVFQYVTGLTAATALAQMILSEGDKSTDRYIKHLLKAGASDYSITLLKKAGVDLTTTKPYEIAMADFKRTLEQAEALVQGIKKKR